MGPRDAGAGARRPAAVHADDLAGCPAVAGAGALLQPAHQGLGYCSSRDVPLVRGGRIQDL